MVVNYLVKTWNWMQLHGPQGIDLTSWKQPRIKPVPQDKTSGNSTVTSLALSWLITNCEVPESIQIALQSIAGATQGVPRHPLLDCGATLEILRRLASASLYKDSGPKAQEVVSRYSRALIYLGGSLGSTPYVTQQGQGDELEGTIWDLHLVTEKKVADLIVNGSFRLTQTNINAFRLGNTDASSTLTMLKKGNINDTQFNEMIGSISELLRLYLSENDTLHDSALLSLVNAAALLYLFTPKLPSTSDLPLSLVTLANSSQYSSTPLGKLVIALAVICALSRNRLSSQDDIIHPTNRSWLEGAVRALVKMNSQNEMGLDLIIAFGLQALAACQNADNPDNIASQMRETLLQQATSRVHTFFDRLANAVPFIPTADIPEDTISSYLQAFDGTCHLGPFGTASSSISFFALTYICSRDGRNPFVEDYVAPTLARWPFPRLSGMLTWMLEEREFIPLLEEKSNSKYRPESFIATGQLWLLFTLYQYSADGTPDDREKLGAQLRRSSIRNPFDAEARHRELGEQLVRSWNSRRLHYSTPGIWECRLMECVFQFQNTQAPSSVYERSQQQASTAGLAVETVTSNVHVAHTYTDGITPAPQTTLAANGNNLNLEVNGTAAENEAVSERVALEEDDGALHQRAEAGNSGQDMARDQQGRAEEEITRAPDGQEGANQNGVISTGGVDSVKVGQTESNSPYTVIDMRSPRDVPE